MTNIKSILIKRDGMSENDAEILIEEARKAFNEYLDQGNPESAYEICSVYFGLEPDYLDEFI